MPGYYNVLGQWVEDNPNDPNVNIANPPAYGGGPNGGGGQGGTGRRWNYYNGWTNYGDQGDPPSEPPKFPWEDPTWVPPPSGPIKGPNGEFWKATDPYEPPPEPPPFEPPPWEDPTTGQGKGGYTWGGGGGMDNEIITPGTPGTPGGDPATFDLNAMMLANWKDIAEASKVDPQSLFDIMSQLPAAEGNMELKRALYNQLQELIKSKGQSGLVPVEAQFANVKRDVTEASQEQWQNTQGDLARKGMLESGAMREQAFRRDVKLNQDLSTARLVIETNNSKNASDQYTNAINQMGDLQKQAAAGELDWYQALSQTEQWNGEQKRAWAQMGLTERLTVMGYSVDKYKADLGASVDRERIQLEKDLGFAGLDLQKMIADNNFSIEKTKISLQKWMTEGGWAQQDADRATSRWATLINAQVQNRRTDVDMINAMGKLKRDEWEQQVAQADLELKRYLGERYADLQDSMSAQDWAKFKQDNALKQWMAQNQWDTDKYIARLQAEMASNGASSSFWSSLLGAGATIGSAIIQFSSRDFKTDIVPLTATDESEVLQALLNTEVVRFNYKPEFMDGRRHIGVIAEDAPDEITLSDGRHIDLGNAFGTLLAAVKALSRKVEELENAT